MRLLPVLCLLVFSCSLSAQNDEAAISTTLDSYFELIAEKKISEALDYVHPGLIDMLGKEMFESQYEQLFNSPGIEVSMDGFSQDSISSSLVLEEQRFVLVKYGFKMTFKVDMSKDKDGLLGPVLLSSYQSKFGKENVTSPQNGTYVIENDREMFACSSPDFEGWKILDYEPGMKIILVQIIPESVLTHFKK